MKNLAFLIRGYTVSSSGADCKSVVKARVVQLHLRGPNGRLAYRFEHWSVKPGREVQLLYCPPNWKGLINMLQTLRQVKDRRAKQNMRNAMKAQARKRSKLKK